MKEELKLIAAQLFMKYGLKSVSMDDIAKAAGVSKKTIYQNINDKESLIHETLIDFINEDKKSVEKAVARKDINALEKMILVMEQGIEIFKKIKPTVLYDLKKYYRKSWDVVQRHHFEFMHGIIEDNISLGKLEKVYREDVDAEIVSRLFVGKMLMLGEEDQFPANKFSKSYLYYQQLMYHLYGLVNLENYKCLEELSTKLSNKSF